MTNRSVASLGFEVPTEPIWLGLGWRPRPQMWSGEDRASPGLRECTGHPRHGVQAEALCKLQGWWAVAGSKTINRLWVRSPRINMALILYLAHPRFLRKLPKLFQNHGSKCSHFEFRSSSNPNCPTSTGPSFGDPVLTPLGCWSCPASRRRSRPGPTGGDARTGAGGRWRPAPRAPWRLWLWAGPTFCVYGGTMWKGWKKISHQFEGWAQFTRNMWQFFDRVNGF